MKRQLPHYFEYTKKKKKKCATEKTVLKYTTIIYGYKKKSNEQIVYIGQTRQHLAVRDQQQSMNATYRIYMNKYPLTLPSVADYQSFFEPPLVVDF
jgi:hypothetical protein